MKQAGWRLFVKRGFDVAAAAVGIVATAPVLSAACVAVAATMGRPVTFSQIRPGKGGRPFRIYKLRTMSDARDAEGRLLPDAERLTRVGRFLRTTSIDELPQLWNVLRGDISLVGPRPLLMQYLARYSPEQARRHDVLPGITGWAQVNGRNAVAWEQRFALDTWYVDNWSLALDARILAATVRKVLQRDGIAESGGVTMTEFRGTSPLN